MDERSERNQKGRHWNNKVPFRLILVSLVTNWNTKFNLRKLTYFSVTSQPLFSFESFEGEHTVLDPTSILVPQDYVCFGSLLPPVLQFLQGWTVLRICREVTNPNWVVSLCSTGWTSWYRFLYQFHFSRRTGVGRVTPRVLRVYRCISLPLQYPLSLRPQFQYVGVSHPKYFSPVPSLVLGIVTWVRTTEGLVFLTRCGGPQLWSTC